MLDDREMRRLLLATAGRDAASFETLYRKSAPLLLAVALRIVGRRELAEEVLHDAFIRVWHAAERFDPLAPSPVAWLVTIVRNRAIDLVSSASMRRTVAVDGDPEERAAADVRSILDEALGETASAEQMAESERRAARVRQCLEELRAVERQSLVLAYHHGLSHSELAVRMNKPIGTVKSWVRRALGHLRECVEASVGGTG